MSAPVLATRPAGRAMIFSLVFGVIYAFCFYYNWALFAYYPQVNEVHTSSLLVETLGPPILWYGWMASAALIAGVSAFIIPRGLSDRLWDGWAWIVPGAVVVAILIYEKRWFVQP